MYTVKTTDNFDRQLKKMDRSVQIMIVKWIRKHLLDCEDPRVTGKALTANLKGYWRYRIGDYRLIAEIREDELLIIAVDIGHRRAVYSR